jgi:hypothetical protein
MNSQLPYRAKQAHHYNTDAAPIIFIIECTIKPVEFLNHPLTSDNLRTSYRK